MLDVERFDVALLVGFYRVQFDKPRISTGCESPGMDKSKFGAKLRIARTRLGLRQVDVATIAGVSRTTVSKAERGLLHAFSIDIWSNDSRMRSNAGLKATFVRGAARSTG